ncbi:hypothetical protein D3C76_1079000 [compost metagenome]
MELLQPPLRPEERFEVIQRSIGRPHHEGVAPRQALLEETVDLGIPAPLQFAQGFNVQHLRRLIGHFSDLVVDRFRQACGHPLQGADRVVPGHRETLMYDVKCGLAAVRAVLHGLGVVVHGRDGAEGFIVVAGLITACLQQGTQACKSPLDGQRLLLLAFAACRPQRRCLIR